MNRSKTRMQDGSKERKIRMFRRKAIRNDIKGKPEDGMSGWQGRR